MNKEDVLKELYDQCEFEQIDKHCGLAGDCEYCFIEHALEYIEDN